MCEINPKRAAAFRLEFFTAHEVSKERWNKLVLERLLDLEQAFNETGEIRVHIHKDENCSANEQ